MVWRYQIYHKALGLLDFLGFDHVPTKIITSQYSQNSYLLIEY